MSLSPRWLEPDDWRLRKALTQSMLARASCGLRRLRHHLERALLARVLRVRDEPHGARAAAAEHAEERRRLHLRPRARRAPAVAGELHNFLRREELS